MVDTAIVSFIGALCALLAVSYWRSRRRFSLPLPPGPRKLPIIGNVLDIPSKNPAEVYHQWSQRYGMFSWAMPIISLTLL